MSRKRLFQTVRGMRDILPQDQAIFEWIILTVERLSQAYGFSKIETPIVEDIDLFRKSAGVDSDVVKKEMFVFKDQGGKEVALRPAMTASMVRAYIEHGLMNQPKPVKLYQIGACFMYERPQSGRLRQFHQFNPEIIGSEDPATDAELITLAYVILKELGLDPVIQVNSIGSPESRKQYIKQLKSFYRPKFRYVCQDCRQRYKINPLRLLDCKKKKCADYFLEAPQIVDYLDDESKNHFMKLLEYLGDFNLPYVLNPQIVKGVDYYTKTVFEIWVKDEDGLRTGALGGGGRYDNLVELFCGKPAPACGFALGLERVAAKIKERKIPVPVREKFSIFLAHLGEEGRKQVFKLFEQLWGSGYKVIFNLSKSSLKQQLELADKADAVLTLIIGEKEAANKEVLIKEMHSGAQESVPEVRLVKELEKRLNVI